MQHKNQMGGQGHAPAHPQNKIYIEQHFRNMLSRVVRLDQPQANEIERQASYYHSYAAQEITNVIKDFIIDVSTNPVRSGSLHSKLLHQVTYQKLNYNASRLTQVVRLRTDF